MPNPVTLAKAIFEASPRGRMARGILANVYDKGAVTLVQLMSIPILTATWGGEGYGIWLMLLTVPTYIALSDLGFGTAAGVILTQCASSGDHDRANRVLQSTIAFVMGTVCVAGLIALAYALWLGTGQPDQPPQSSPFSAPEIAVAIGFITLYAMVLTQMSIVTVVFRATHKFAFAMVFAGTWILLEGGALVALAYHGFGIAHAAGAYFAIRLVGYIAFTALLRRKEPWVKVGVKRADRATIRALANPSLAALGLTFATAVSLQGMVLALGAAAGPAVVAIFGAARTLSRAPLQLSGMVLRPSIPELTRAITEGNTSLERRLTRMNILVSLAVTLPFGVILTLAGPWILSLMSGGALTASWMLFALLSLTAISNATWMALATPLIAMNRQAEFSYLYLLAALFAVVIAYGFSQDGWLWAAATGCIVEGVILGRLWFVSTRD